MNRYKTRKELKNEAKKILKSNWKDSILLSIIPTLFIIIGIGSFSYIYKTHTTVNGSFILNLIISLLFTLIYIGVSFTFLDWLRNPSMKIDPLKDSTQTFTNKYFTPILFINLLIYIFTFLWSLLFIIPGIIQSISYSQTSFIYKDINENNEELTYNDYITKSKILMMGHKWRYFILQLSFIGWHLLAILTLGIGYIWLTPYIIATNAAFYKDLAKNNTVT